MKKLRNAKEKSASHAREARSLRARPTRPESRAVGAPAPASASLTCSARVKVSAFSRDDRLSLALLLLPVMVLTLAVGGLQSLAPSDSVRRQLALLPVATSVSASAPPRAFSAESISPESTTLSPLADRPAPAAAMAAVPLEISAVDEHVSIVPPVAELRELPPVDAILPRITTLPARWQPAPLPVATSVPPAAPPRVLSDEPIFVRSTTLSPLADRPTTAVAVAAVPLQTSAVDYEHASLVPMVAELRELPPGGAILTKIASLGHPDRCVMASGAKRLISANASTSLSPEAFGRMLAAAARRETEDLVVYTDHYKDIGFPMGDVPALYGVCTDVVVRAYRALGIDLQVLVHNARLGTGDPSIDHRRVETLRRFFAKYGASLPVTDFVEDYQPGDIVTYRRPEGRGSQTHIAIVSDVIAPSGRPMVVHNRSWGPQLEDALFANGLTGHYRFAVLPGQQLASEPVPPLPMRRALPEAGHLMVSVADTP